MQPSVLVPLANGFEEIEAITIIDVLRRAGIEVIVAGLETLHVFGAHGLEVVAQLLLENVSIENCDMLILPGGMPGADNLRKDERLRSIVQKFNHENKPLGAICAAPWALSDMDVLKEHFTCYPSFEKRIDHGNYHGEKNVVIDENIFTASGPATAMEFALQITKTLRGEEVYNQVKAGLLFK
jgi:4-methyl-5(b-hydroxyethyl)-thiazole monophosphate biosynthesis